MTNMNQREIKFRAWDKEMEEWVYAEPVYGFFPSIATERAEGRYSEPMQFTGLKDKNGVEIYEGDIVGRSWEGIDEQTHMSAPQEVVWLGQGWNLKPQEGDNPSGAIGGSYQKETEVIGNIYETPELLK